MATKRFKSGAWEFKIQRKGLLPKPVYVRFDDEQEGEVWVRRMEALLDRGIVPEQFQTKVIDTKLLRDQVRAYLDTQHVAADDKKTLAVVLTRFPSTLDLSALTFVWAQSWVTSLKREYNLSPSTIRHHVGAVARALDWVTANGDLVFNPLRLLRKGYATYTPADAAALVDVQGAQLKVDNERDRRLEGDEEKRIRAILAGGRPKNRQRPLELRHGDSVRLMFDMAVETAMRMREMFTLSVGQVDLQRRTIFLDKTKNGDKRQVPITSVLLALLPAHLEGRKPDDLLYPWWSGSFERKELNRTTAQLSRQFARVFDAAGCVDLNFHDMRHEATSRLFERTTLSDLEISKITGHKDPRQLKRYANLRASTLAERLW